MVFCRFCFDAREGIGRVRRREGGEDSIDNIKIPCASFCAQHCSYDTCDQHGAQSSAATNSVANELDTAALIFDEQLIFSIIDEFGANWLRRQPLLYD